jgi:hypothetical protein
VATRGRKEGIGLKKARMLRVIGALGALSALTVVGAGGAASASSPAKSGATVIKMARDGKDLFFEGPATVAAGTDLKIKNKTNPRQVGPHTFSLVHEKDIPTEPKKIKACGKKLKGICGEIAFVWHGVDLQTGEIAENPVDVGKQGWDKQGSLKHKGDSWVAEQKGQSFTREVTAEPGKVLHYICAVHPFMVGEITVTE